MKNRYQWILLMAMVLAAGCTSQKKTSLHSHDGAKPHAHTTNKSESNTDYFGDYILEDAAFGTKTKVNIVGEQRVMETNALPNHKTGAFPRKGNPNTIAAQNKNYTFPLHPKYVGTPQWVREPGVSLNGVKFEPGTAEVVICDTGENYRVEAFQDVINLGLDFNNAHVQPTGAYHYHGTPTSVIEAFDTGNDLVHIGFAHDGFPMYYSKSNAYKSSYQLVGGDREGEDCTYTNPKNTLDISVDGHHNGTYTSDFEYVEGSGDLDACNGITIQGHYMYMVTHTFPYVGRCLMGEVSQDQIGLRGQGGRPNAAQLMERLDENNDGKLSKAEVKGPLSANFLKVDANKDGYITAEELKKSGRPKR
ncbi:YHYH protein [Algibacter mikhailovii]|uniref:YHYH protein n=1 Tax=Algibacter mikhailovii TaxID=425498 RepID=UPI002494AACF|nr:YHYH protein [Algibacter mikhailovii]